MTSPTISVGTDVSGTAWIVAAMLRRNPVFTMWTPSSFGTWSSTMTSPMPALKPTRTGSEMKFAMKPKRRIAATTRIAPTKSVSVASPRASAPGSPPGIACASCAPVRIPSVVVVLTLSDRDDPVKA